VKPKRTRSPALPKPCSVCTHPARETIDSAIVRRVPYRNLKKRFGVSEAALSRHLNEHLAEYVQNALSEYGKEKGVKVLAKLTSLVERLERFLDNAEAMEDGAEFRANAAELRKQLELISKLQGDLQQEGVSNIHLNPQWLQIEAIIVTALEGYPEARESVVNALKAVGNGSSGRAA
jgi:hypothetical protein